MTLAKNEYVYDNGLPFNSALASSLDLMNVRVEQKKAAAILIDGDLGSGKTTLAVEVADRLEGEPIDLERQLALGGDDLLRKAVWCHRKKKKVVIYDEAGDFTGSRSLTNFNFKLYRFFQMYRALKVIVIIVLPKFYTLDRRLLELGVIRFLVHCDERRGNSGRYRVFDAAQMWYIKAAADKLKVRPRCYSAGVMNYAGNFKDLPPARRDELEKVSTSNKLQEIQAEVDHEQRMKNLTTTKGISVTLGLSYMYVLEKLREIKPKVVIQKGRVKYYDLEVIERVRELLKR